MNRIVFLSAAITLAVFAAVASVAVASASAAPTLTNRTVTIKIAGSQKTTWSAVPQPDAACQGKPTGARGSGTETIEWSNGKVLKGQLTGYGEHWGLMLTDRKGMPTSRMPISGTIDRKGDGASIACGEVGITTDGCLGRQTFTTDAQFAFLTGRRFTVDDPNVTMTTGLYPNCDWVWNGMTVRTGAVLLNVGKGKFDPKRLARSRSSVTFKTREEQRCENEGADPGVQCVTVTEWRVTLYPAKKKRRR